jgi:hypothetical protein
VNEAEAKMAKEAGLWACMSMVNIGAISKGLKGKVVPLLI